MSAPLLFNLCSTLYLCGLIWTIQAVHYPLFLRFDAAQWGAGHASHTARITLIAAPAMLMEAGSAVWLVLVPAPLSTTVAWLGLAMVAGAWASTFLLQVPCHNRLAAEGFSTCEIRRLVRGNWLRTVFWTARGLMLATALAAQGASS